ncbi:MAG: alanine dehydrogenase [Lentimicrobiaceae bacterium]|nr:alanine dehydrogenase [Lentimicrobiaceae bacterium]
MKIGIIKETKIPVDNRVALSPAQVAKLQKDFPDSEFFVQASDIRAYSDNEYRSLGIKVVDNVDDCDVLFGIKEATIESLIPNKHYFFFGHIAKMQEYNRPLIQDMIKKNITFSDYEYLVDDNNARVCAFGWWAGVVGVYYTLRGYGLRTGKYNLPKPDLKFTLEELLKTLNEIELPAIKVLVTGAGRVSQGAQYVLENINARKMSREEYLNTDDIKELTYCAVDVDGLVRRKDGTEFSFIDFTKNPQEYESDFMKWAKKSDLFISAHFWAPEAPVYLSEEDLKNSEMRIKMIGDVTCDIMGSIKSTVRSSTHAEPYYDYNPATAKEEAAFSSDNNITVMAVDTCPNALALDTSAYFGDMLMKHVFEPMLKNEESMVISRSTILKDGKLTERFAYLKEFAEGK